MLTIPLRYKSFFFLLNGGPGTASNFLWAEMPTSQVGKSQLSQKLMMAPLTLALSCDLICKAAFLFQIFEASDVREVPF